MPRKKTKALTAAEKKAYLKSISPFNVNLLSDMIFDILVSSENTKPSDLAAARCVSKKWLLEIHKRLWKFDIPLFNLTIDGPPYPYRPPNNLVISGAWVYHFLRVMEGSVSAMPPPLTVTVGCNFFRQHNMKKLFTFLQSDVCKTRLIHLNVLLPRYGPNVNFKLSKMPLDALTRLNVEFLFNVNKSSHYPPDSYVGVSYKFAPFIEMITGSAPKLHEVTFKCGTLGRVPDGFGLIPMPTRLTNLAFFSIGDGAIEMLDKSSFDFLTSLTLERRELELSDENLFCVIDRLKATLQSLCIYNPGDITSRVLELGLPVMPRLKNCDIGNFNVKLITIGESMETFGPNLTRIRLNMMSINELLTSAGNKMFPTVKKLETIGFHEGVAGKEVSVREMKMINTIFPNLESCVLIERKITSTALQFIFEKMTRLVRLGIVLDPYPANQDARFWDAMLLGVTLSALDRLQSGSTVYFQRRFTLPSLRNMSRLQELELRTRYDPTSLVIGSSFISDLAFRYGFLQMPQLKKLELAGRFRPSRIMSDELGFQWIRKDGSWKFTCFP